jgi:hypothetical protein
VTFERTDDLILNAALKEMIWFVKFESGKSREVTSGEVLAIALSTLCPQEHLNELL